MKRDKDYLREIILEIEASADGSIDHVMASGATTKELKLDHHLDLLMDEGLVARKGTGSFRLTPLGHDAAEAVGKPEFWVAVKEKAPSEAYDTVKGMASSITILALSRLLGLG